MTRTLALTLALSLLAGTAAAQQSAAARQLDAPTRTRLASNVTAALRASGIPGAQIAVVRDGELAYTGAFGLARLEPATPVTAEMPFRIGSNSKQFTAAAAMVLVEEGKLRLDDPVATWFPELAHAREITLRQLLNQVSGYEDDYTEDYLTPEMAAPSDPYHLVARWAAKPLDFAPGTRWEYSNINYAFTALIVEKVSGQPFFQFLREHVLAPAGIEHALDLDATAKIPPLPQGYSRYAFGPPRAVPPEGGGTLQGDAGLAMPVSDLARWDAVVLRGKLLKPESWQALESEYPLPNGHGSGYGMGFFLGVHRGHRVLEHSGEVNGFISENILYPSLGVAIAVLTNGQSSTDALVKAAEDAVLPAVTGHPAPPHDAQAEALLRRTLAGLAHGELDRSALTPALAFYFSPQAIADYRNTLTVLGALSSLTPTAREERGGMVGTWYTAQFASGKHVTLSTYVTADGKLDQLLLEQD